MQSAANNLTAALLAVPLLGILKSLVCGHYTEIIFVI